MNLRRGLFRLWLALSLPWVTVMVAIGYYKWSEYYNLTTHTGRRFGTVLLVDYLVYAVSAPIALAILLAVGAWIARGFKP